MNKSFILSYQTGNEHNSQNDTIFQLNMAQNVSQDFGKYNIMLNYFVTWRSAIFLNFHDNSGMH